MPFIVDANFEYWIQTHNWLRSTLDEDQQRDETSANGRHVVRVAPEAKGQGLPYHVLVQQEPCVYALFSSLRNKQKQRDFYIGSSPDVLRRLGEHNDAATSLTSLFDSTTTRLDRKRRGALMTAYGAPWTIESETCFALLLAISFQSSLKVSTRTRLRATWKRISFRTFDHMAQVSGEGRNYAGCFREAAKQISDYVRLQNSRRCAEGLPGYLMVMNSER